MFLRGQNIRTKEGGNLFSDWLSNHYILNLLIFLNFLAGTAFKGKQFVSQFHTRLRLIQSFYVSIKLIYVNIFSRSFLKL